MEDNLLLLPSRLKVKLGTSEMKMRNKICKCLYILPKEQIQIFNEELASLDLELGSPLRVSRIIKTKGNPYFIWSDLQKLQETYQGFGAILEEIISRDEEKNLQRVVEKSKLYRYIIEELVQTLLEIIHELCISLATHLPRSFPTDFTPRENQIQEPWSEKLPEAERLQQRVPEKLLEAEKPQQERPENLLEADKTQHKLQEVLLEADRPQHEAKTRVFLEADQQERPEVPEVNEAEKPQHRVEQALLEADRPRLETLKVPLELHQPQEEVTQPEVPLEAEQPQQEVLQPEVLLEAVTDRPQQEIAEDLL